MQPDEPFSEQLSRREFLATCGALLTLAHTRSSSAVSASDQPWRPLDFGKISVGGDLGKRSQQNEYRLRHTAYCVPKVFASITQKDFPGDWIGRTLLGTTLLAHSMSRDAPEAHRLVQGLPARLNAAGYLGNVFDPRLLLNELQLGPHGWLIRGLCEYYLWTRDRKALEILQRMLQTLALPLAGLWETYPLAPEARQSGQGGMIGDYRWRAGRWMLTTDIGTIFVLLDGLTQAWQIDRSAELKAVIDAGIERFLQMDLMLLQAQAHATLTTLRALLRLYAQTGEAHLLRAVEERYGLYRREVMTENYANYNYFGRPETWTEPCAVIDSFMIATQLWQFTGQAKYLQDAHLIWFNGLGHGQRSTGGFGTDTCAGAKEPFIQMQMYEATICCTMRGGEGLSYAIQTAYHTRPGELAITHYCDSKADVDVGSGRLTLKQTTDYPYDGSIRLEVVSSTMDAPLALRLFMPEWLEQPRLRLNGKPVSNEADNGFIVTQFKPQSGDILTLDSKLITWTRPTSNPHSIAGYHAFHAGPLLLGYRGNDELRLAEDTELIRDAPGRYRAMRSNAMLSRINDVNEMPPPRRDPLDYARKISDLADLSVFETDLHRCQVLFKG